jgi:Coenzyme PQQ synthesis protein D (PqqD)
VSSPLKLRRDALDWREVEGEIVAIDLESSNYLAGNRSAAVLWPALVEGTTRDALADLLIANFEVDRASAESDVDRFLTVLADHGLLEH